MKAAAISPAISLATSPVAAMIPATEGIKADRKWVRR